MKDVSKKVDGLGLRIAQSRTKLGLSQNNVSDLIGIPRPNYTAIENEVSGRFLKDYQLKNIAMNLKVSSDYLLGLISDPNPNAEVMSIINSLGLSGDAIEFIQSLKSDYKSRTLHILNDFIKWTDTKFLESLSLYKRVKTFFNTEYSFVLTFLKDIESCEIDIYTKSEIDFSSLQSNYKYFYHNLDDAKKYFELRKKMIFESNYTLSEAFDKLLNLQKSGECTENFIYLYQDKTKLEDFRNALEKVKKISHDLTMLLDFDETGVIFSTAEKQAEISEIIDKLLSIINTSSLTAIDTLITSLYTALSFFTQTINSSLDFIKYRINTSFNSYLDEYLEI